MSTGPFVLPEPSVAVVIPCHNEESSVEAVVRDFRDILPRASVYVFDNASTDTTSRRALAAGAIVGYEPRKGKGHVVRRMFADIEADVYVLVDGDDTYDAFDAPDMIDQLLTSDLDMVVGARQPAFGGGTVYRRGHVIGNAFFSWTVRALYGGDFRDVFSGYRVMSRRFVKSLPIFADGFEVETELTAHATRVHAGYREAPTTYRSREDGSESKLRTYRDGLRILAHVIRLFEEMHPLKFFAAWFGVLTAISLALGLPVVDHFAHTGRVPRFPTALLALGIQIVALICLTAGVILRSVGRTRDEARRLRYLAIPGLRATVVERSARLAKSEAIGSAPDPSGRPTPFP